MDTVPSVRAIAGSESACVPLTTDDVRCEMGALSGPGSTCSRSAENMVFRNVDLLSRCCLRLSARSLRLDER